MATDNASSRDSAVIDDDLVEALGFEPTSTPNLAQASDLETKLDSLDDSAVEDSVLGADAADLDALTDREGESASDVSEPESSTDSPTDGVVILGGGLRGDDASTDAVVDPAAEQSEAPKRRSLFGNRRSAEADQEVSTPDDASVDSDDSVDDSASIPASPDDFMSELLAEEDVIEQNSTDQSEVAGEAEVEPELDLTDGDLESDLVDLTDIDLEVTSVEDGAAATVVDPATTESAFPEVPALTEVDAESTSAELFTQPVEVEEIDLVSVEPHLLTLDETLDTSADLSADAEVDAESTQTTTAASPTPMRRRTRVRAKKTRRVIRHIDPWSVLTFSALFHLALYTAFLLASVLVWEALEASGMVENIEDFIIALGDYETYEINADVLFRAGVIVAGILTVASTILSVLLCVVFNLISDLVGGIRVTVLEEETVRIPSKKKSPKTK